MKITDKTTGERILVELGERLSRLRLDRNLKQAELAAKAGVSLRTVQRLESGAVATHLSGFIRVCRALNLLDRLESFLPEPIPSPIAQIQSRGRPRRRASGAPPAERAAGRWTWGEPS